MGQRRVGGVVCRLVSVHPAPPLMLSQCFFSLSLELVLRYRPSTLAHPMPGGPVEEDRPLRPCPPAAGAPAHSPAARRPTCLITDSCCPALRGLSVWGEGSRVETEPALGPRPQKCQRLAASDPRRHPALRTPEAIAGPRRPASSAVVLSCLRVPSSLHPQCFFWFFFSPFRPSSPCSPSLGSAQVNRLPLPPASWITSSRHVSFSFLFVCV